MTNSAEVWDILKMELQTKLMLIQDQTWSWISLTNLTCTNYHHFVVVYSDFVKLFNQLRPHKFTAVNDKIYFGVSLAETSKYQA